MIGRRTLEEYLRRYSETGPVALAAAAAIDAVAVAATEIAELIGRGRPSGASSLAAGRNSDGDLQKDLDIRTDAILRRCLGKVPLAAFASEEAREPEIGDRTGKICIAIDPLDGSSNI